MQIRELLDQEVQPFDQRCKTNKRIVEDIRNFSWKGFQAFSILQLKWAFHYLEVSLSRIICLQVCEPIQGKERALFILFSVYSIVVANES